ncbi:MAG: hypothetical protein M3237_10890, partial [Actinomycetota bacterium]|nr:hypothetical protein [Actinomycetota bacterium]
MKRLAACAATLTVVGVALVGTAGPGSAATAHCADFNSPDKVELDGETTSVNLPAGSTVCYKSSTEVFTVVVGADGVLTSEATNKHGRIQGIS